MEYEWNFSLVARHAPQLFRGLAMTMIITTLTAAFGIPLAIGVATARTARPVALRLIAATFIEIFRDIPVLVLLVWMYFCLPVLTDGGLNLPSAVVAVLALGLNFAALEAEIIRAGISNIPRAEIEVARGFGFSRIEVLRHVVLPQAFWRSLAPTVGQIVNTLKLSALAAFISVSELFFTTLSLIQDTARPLEFYTALALLYLIAILPPAALAHALERRLTPRFSGTE